MFEGELADGINAWILGLKDDEAHIAVSHDNFLLMHPNLDFSPLAPVGFLSEEEQHTTLVSVFVNTFYLAEHGTQVLHAALTTNKPRSLDELRAAVMKLATPRDTYSRRDAINGVVQRLERFCARYPGIARSTRGISFDTLAQHSLYFPVTTLRDAEDFLWTLLVHYLFAKKRHEQHRSLTHTLVLDEGLSSWGTQKRHTTIGGAPLLSSLATMTREFGIGFLVTTTTPSMTDPLIKSNAATQIALNLNAAVDAQEVSKTFGLDAEQTKFLTTKLSRGQAILKLGDGWREPILLTIPPPTHSKTVTPEDMQRLQDRTDAVARRYTNARALSAITNRPVAPLDERALSIRTGTFDAISTTPTDVSLSETTPEEERIADAAFDAMPPTPAQKRPRPGKKDTGSRLSLHETVLLKEIAVAGSILVAAAYRRAALHFQAGDRSKKRLLALGLITQTRVITRAGRGGTGICLEPTSAAFPQLGLKPVHATRGGDSAQHRFLVRRLHDLTGAVIEMSIAGKSADLYLPHSTTTAAFMQTIKEKTQAFGETTPGTMTGVAIEVECSDPAKTGPENVRRNHEAGIALTILAVLHLTKTLSAIERAIPEDLRPHVLIIDVLDLIDLLEQHAPARGGAPDSV